MTTFQRRYTYVYKMRTQSTTYSIEMYLSLDRNEIDSPILVCSKQRDITDVDDDDDDVCLIICFAYIYLLGFSFVDSKRVNGFYTVLCPPVFLLYAPNQMDIFNLRAFLLLLLLFC